MRHFHFTALLLFLVGAYFSSAPRAKAASTDIVINEIAAYPTSSHEWVEVFNRGNSSIDLARWKFAEFDGTKMVSHALQPLTTSELAPSSFAIIAQNSSVFLQDHPGFTPRIFGSSWSSLSTAGEQISLFDENGTAVESFTYLPAPNSSLERKEASIADYSALNWYVRSSGHSAGQINAASIPETPLPPPLLTTTSPIITTPDSVHTTTTLWAALRLNEISPVPVTGSEWVELYNPNNESLDLAGGILCDDRTTSCTVATLSGSIPAHGFFVVMISGSKLNNDGDSVILKNPAGSIIDQFTYGSAFLPVGGQVIARSGDGVGAWAVSTISTMGVANIISAPPSSGVSGAIILGSSDETTLDELAVGAGGSKGIVWYATSTAPLRITEIFPNPEGDDARDEFVEIINQSTETIDLPGWKLWIDGATFALSGELEGGDVLAIHRSNSHLELKNTTSSVIRILNPDLAIESEAAYPYPAPSGLSFTEVSIGEWRWLKPTPRVLSTSTNKITWRLSVPQVALINDPVTLSLGATADPRGGTWSAIWTVDGREKKGANTVVTFVTSGIHTLTVQATSSMGTVGTTQAELLVTADAISCNGDIRLSELFVHPASAENDEFIEIINDGLQAVRLDGWRLSVKSGKSYIIPNNSIIAPGGILVFYQSVTGLALLDSGEIVSVLDSAGTMIDRRVVPKISEDISFQRIDGVWKTFPARSPGRLLSFPDGVGGGEEAPSRSSSVKKTLKKSTVKKIKTSSVSKVVSPRDITALPKGARVITEGIVVALPRSFGVQYAAIATDNGGVLLYQNQKKFPAFDYGDRVRVKGVVSEAAGRKRLTVAQPNDIDILSTNNTLDPSNIALNELSLSDLGKLITIEGELTSKTASRGFIDDGTDELPFAIKTGTKISTKNWKVGMRLTLTGVVMATTKGLELWPRRIEDVRIETAVSSSEQVVSSSVQSISSTAYSASPHIYPIIVGGLLLTNAGFLWRLYRERQRKCSP